MKTTPGRVYRVDYASTITNATWTALGPQFAAAGAVTLVSDTMNSQRYYRLALVQ